MITASLLAVVAIYTWCALYSFFDTLWFKGKLRVADECPLFPTGLFQSQPGGCWKEEGQKRLNS